MMIPELAAQEELTALNNPKMFSQGFTFIELLVTIAISGLLLGLGVTAYNNFSDHQKLLLAVRSLKTNLRAAQAKAMANKIPTGCGDFKGYRVEFTEEIREKYTTAAICGEEVFDEIETALPNNIVFSSDPTQVLFLSLSGRVSTQVVLTLERQETTDEATVTITSSGEIK